MTIEQTIQNLIDWHDALLSGEFSQGRGAMCIPATDQHCCINVAKVAVLGMSKEYNWKEGVVLNAVGVAGAKVFLGIQDMRPTDTFVGLNDHLSLTFAQIADVIMQEGILPALEAIGEDPEDWV